MKILSLQDAALSTKEFSHLFEISTLPAAFVENQALDWRVRDGYSNAGTLLVGDLRVMKSSTAIVEIHPFPEWLVEILQPGQQVGKAYAIVPNWSIERLERIKSKAWEEKLSCIEKHLQETSADEWLAITYQPGVCIKIPAYVPHEFLAVVKEGEIHPYLQCFEPNFEFLSESLGINPTALFSVKEVQMPIP